MPADDMTPGQVAQQLETDPSTLRLWARLFASHLSPQAQAKRRRYTSADLATLSRAGDLLRAGKDAAEVAALLGSVAQEKQPAQVPAAAAAPLPSMVLELQEARELVRAMLAQLDQLRQDQEASRGELDLLRAAHDDQAARISKLLAQLRAEQAADHARQVADRARLDVLERESRARRSRPWYQRLFGGR